MRPVDVGVHRRESVSETLGNKRLRRKVIAFVKLVSADDAENTGVTFQSRGMQRDAVEQMLNPIEATLRIFQGHTSNKSVNLVFEIEEHLSKITAVLSGQSGNERSLGHSLVSGRVDVSRVPRLLPLNRLSPAVRAPNQSIAECRFRAKLAAHILTLFELMKYRQCNDECRLPDTCRRFPVQCLCPNCSPASERFAELKSAGPFRH